MEGEIERAVLVYFTALNRAFATGDTAGYAATFTSRCAPCATVKSRLQADLAKGNRLDGLRDELSNLKVTVGNNNTGFVNVEVRVPPYRLLDHSGKVVGNYISSSSTANVTVYKTPAGWKVIDIRDAAA